MTWNASVVSTDEDSVTFRTLLAGKLSPHRETLRAAIDSWWTNCTKKPYNGWLIQVPGITSLGLCIFLPTSLTSPNHSKVGWTFWGSCNRFCWVGFQRERWFKHVFSTRRDTTWLLGPFLKKTPQVSMAMMALKFSFFGNTKTGSNKNRRGKFTNVAGCRSPSNVPPHEKLNWNWLVHLGRDLLKLVHLSHEKNPRTFH